MFFRSKISYPALQAIGGIVLTILLLAIFFRGTDLNGLFIALKGGNFSLLVLAVLMMLITYVLRALRWQMLLSPLGRANLWNCFVATVIGFAVNFLVVPGRLGEVVRPYLLARQEGFSASSAFATVFVERILDLVAVVVLIGAWLVFGPPLNSNDDVLEALKIGGIIGFLGASLVLLLLFWYARSQQRVIEVLELVLKIFPDKLKRTMSNFMQLFRHGLGVLVDQGNFIKAVGMSILVWLNISFAFWVGARAFGISFAYGDTFLVIGFLTLGVAMPTPGGVGGYHYMCALALTTLFGVGQSVAQAVALANHAIAFLPVTLLGILLLPRVGLSLHQLKSMSRSAKE